MKNNAAIFIFPAELISAINKEYPQNLFVVEEKIIREEAYALLIFLIRNVKMDAIEKDISLNIKMDNHFKLRKIIQIAEKRNRILNRFRKHFIDNFFSLVPEKFYDVIPSLRRFSENFIKFRALEKIGIAEWKVEALSIRNTLHTLNLKLPLGINIIEAEKQEFFPKNVFRIK